jgi:hypothetical protein
MHLLFHHIFITRTLDGKQFPKFKCPCSRTKKEHRFSVIFPERLLEVCLLSVLRWYFVGGADVPLITCGKTCFHVIKKEKVCLQI